MRRQAVISMFDSDSGGEDYAGEDERLSNAVPVTPNMESQQRKKKINSCPSKFGERSAIKKQSRLTPQASKGQDNRARKSLA